jgi:hypothetical protein
MLTFHRGNAKLAGNIATFSIPSGYTCPGASVCLSFANRQTGLITDGRSTQFRCFSTSQECVYPNVRKSRWANFEALRGLNRKQMRELILASLIPSEYYRVHVSGDFFSQDYFDAWMDVARANPKRKFYAYTKSLPYWVKRLKTIPKNFALNASTGGKFDDLIVKHNLKCVQVVFSQVQADNLDLKIDRDDSLAMTKRGDFALLIHGTQPAKSDAAAAWAKVKVNEGGYSRREKGTY